MNQLPKSMVREIRTPRCVGAGATRWWGEILVPTATIGPVRQFQMAGVLLGGRLGYPRSAQPNRRDSLVFREP